MQTISLSAKGMNHAMPLSSQAKLVLIYRPRRDGKLSWPCVAGWLHTVINLRHRQLNPDTVAHLSTNRAPRRLTSLIEANELTTTPDHQTTHSYVVCIEGPDLETDDATNKDDEDGAEQPESRAGLKYLRSLSRTRDACAALVTSRVDIVCVPDRSIIGCT